MNYLEICRETAQISGLVDPRSVVSTVNPTGVVRELVRIVADGWVQIQNESQRWRFLVKEFPDDAVVEAGVDRLTPANLNIPDWSEWIVSGTATVPMTTWPASPEERGRERLLRTMSWQDFRAQYRFGSAVSQAVDSQPQAVAVDIDDGLALWPRPDKRYRITGTYRRTPQFLAADDDVPIIAEEFHTLLAWTGKLMLDQITEAENNVLVGDVQLPTAYMSRMAALRRRYSSGDVRFEYDTIGPGRVGRQQSLSVGFGSPVNLGN